MGMKSAEEPFNMGMFILPKASFKMGPFSDPQHTHPGISILESPPWGFESVLLQGLGIPETPGTFPVSFLAHYSYSLRWALVLPDEKGLIFHYAEICICRYLILMRCSGGARPVGWGR